MNNTGHKCRKLAGHAAAEQHQRNPVSSLREAEARQQVKRKLNLTRHGDKFPEGKGETARVELLAAET